MNRQKLRLAAAVVLVVATATLVSAASAAPGNLDPSFDGDGLVVTDFPSFALERANALVRQPDGNLVAAGSVGFVGSNSRFGLARYNPDGSLDSTFDGDGLVVTDFPVSGTADANALVLQPDGKLVAAGGVGFIPSGFALARYNPNGSLDSTFDGDGRVVTGFPPVPLAPTFSPARAVILQPDGKLVVAGNTTGAGDCRFVLARYNPDGSLDSTFDGDGIAVATSSAGCEANALALQPDGKLVVAGNVSTNFSGSERHFALVRFNSDGSLDSTFDGDGLVVTNFFSSSLFDSANAVLAQPDGKLVAAGSIGSFDGFALARYNPDGSLDLSFEGDGRVVTGLPSFPARATALIRQPDAKLVAAGFVSLGGPFAFAVARYNPDGSLDSSFDGDGLVATDFPSSAQDFAFALVLQPDGKLVAAGEARVAGDGGFGGFGLARYQGDLLDVTPPVISVPADITVDATNPAGAVVSYLASATDDVDGSVPVTCVPPPGNLFPIGDTTVTCTATDAAGNIATASFTVHVKGASEQLNDLLDLVDRQQLGPGTSLHDKLVAVLAALDANHREQACATLKAFVRSVEAQTGKSLAAEEAAQLIADALRIENVIGC